MTLDEKVLDRGEARSRQRLVDLESQTAHARIDYHHAIKKLHAAGGSLREIAEALELSHQRVHQIVEGPPRSPGPPWMPRGGWRRHRGRHGAEPQVLRRALRRRRAREVMVEAQAEADSLRHNYIGTEHMMLALVKRGRRAASPYDAARERGRRAGRRGRRAAGSPACRGRSRRGRSASSRRRWTTPPTPGASSSARTTSCSRSCPTRRASAARSFAALGVTPEQLRERPGAVAASAASPPPFSSHEQRRCSCGCLGEQRPDPGVPADRAPSVAAAAAAASSATSAASSAIRSGSSIVSCRDSSERVARNSR